MRTCDKCRHGQSVCEYYDEPIVDGRCVSCIAHGVPRGSLVRKRAPLREWPGRREWVIVPIPQESQEDSCD
jgi:hypothetical protein